MLKSLNNTVQEEPSSFRDPSGHVFRRDGVLFRQVNSCYQRDYDCLMRSGLYQALVRERLLIPHAEVALFPDSPSSVYTIIAPQEIPFISYPFEWCFSQYRDCARTMLRIQEIALAHGMSLKDATPYNIQFCDGRPVHIDTLSFETWEPGRPWVAYRQFCETILAPVFLMAYRDLRLNQMVKLFPEGLPLDLVSGLLPLRAKFNLSCLTHICFHAASQRRFSGAGIPPRVGAMSALAFRGILDDLKSAVSGVKLSVSRSTWAQYYQSTNYSDVAFAHKKAIVAEFLALVNPRQVWDLGANTGVFSRIASAQGIPTVAFDIDPLSVEMNYRECERLRDTKMLPLVLDISNPTGGIGWDNAERMSLAARGPVDLAMALALVHHVRLSHNVPFKRIAEFLSKNCRSLIIEFVPKEDSQAQRLLAGREGIFPDYCAESFESGFSEFFSIEKKIAVRDSLRAIYLMRKRV